MTNLSKRQLKIIYKVQLLQDKVDALQEKQEAAVQALEAKFLAKLDVIQAKMKTILSKCNHTNAQGYIAGRPSKGTEERLCFLCEEFFTPTAEALKHELELSLLVGEKIENET